MLETAIALTFGLHLACVNLASGGPLLCLALEWSEAGGDAWSGRTLRWLAGASVAALLAGMVLGVALAFLSWSPEVARHLWERLTSRFVFGIAEFVFSAVLMVAYWLWCGVPRAALWQRATHRLLAVLAATNLIYHFPLLFGVVALVAHGGASAGPPIESPEFRSLMLRGEVLSLALHFTLASFAVAGVAVMVFAWREPLPSSTDGDVPAEPRESPESAEPPGGAAAEQALDALAGWGARVALVATLLQFPVGLWVWTSLSPNAQYRLTGGEFFAMATFGLSLALMMWLLHALFAAGQGESPRAAAPWCAGLLGAIILLMTAALVATRDARANPPPLPPFTSLLHPAVPHGNAPRHAART